MEYSVLTPEHQETLVKQRILELEAEHYTQELRKAVANGNATVIIEAETAQAAFEAAIIELQSQLP